MEQESIEWWPEVESNHRHEDFQSSALPTELSGHKRGRYLSVFVFSCQEITYQVSL